MHNQAIFMAEHHVRNEEFLSCLNSQGAKAQLQSLGCRSETVSYMEEMSGNIIERSKGKRSDFPWNSKPCQWSDKPPGY